MGVDNVLKGVMISYWIDLAFFYSSSYQRTIYLSELTDLSASGQISWRFPLAFQCVFTFTM
jgi:hypothetical protein